MCGAADQSITVATHTYMLDKKFEMVQSSTQSHVTRSQSLKEKKRKKNWVDHHNIRSQTLLPPTGPSASPGHILGRARRCDAGTCTDAQNLAALVGQLCSTAQAMHLAAKLWVKEEEVTYHMRKTYFWLQEETMEKVLSSWYVKWLLSRNGEI